MPSESRPFTVVDFNNFWSPSGGGVRRYHLQKMAFYEGLAGMRGENLTSIAAKHGTTVHNIKKLNNLRSDRIRYGQRLRVK